jgi:hypothetical protein
MARSHIVDVSDDETSSNHEVPYKGTTFKPRKSIIDDQYPATFWSITSFSETSSWTDAQKDDAIEQARRLATHYIQTIEEHASMLTQLQSSNTQIELQNHEIDNLRQENNDLENELAKKQGAIEYLEGQQRQSSVPPPDTFNPKNRAKLDDPDRFTGDKESKVEFDTWKSNIEAKLKVDGRSFDNENHKIFYVFSRTADAAQDHIRDRVDNEEFATTKEVLQALEVVYGDPHKAIKAEAELQRLGQTLHGSFYAFHSEFVRIVRHLKYDSDKLREQLISCLNNKFISAAGTYLELPYPELVEKLHGIDKRFESQRATRESRKQLTVPSNKPGDKPSSARDSRPASTTSSNTPERIPICTQAEFEALY